MQWSEDARRTRQHFQFPKRCYGTPPCRHSAAKLGGTAHQPTSHRPPEAPPTDSRTASTGSLRYALPVMPSNFGTVGREFESLLGYHFGGSKRELASAPFSNATQAPPYISRTSVSG